MNPPRPLTYSNVVSTLALFLALTGGVVYAAGKIGTDDIKRQSVVSQKIAPAAVKSGKLATQAIGSAKLKDDAIEPSKLTFPVFYAASPEGGSTPVTSAQEPYPINGGQWTQGPMQVQVIFGQATGTLAYDGSGSGSCQVYFEIRLNGQQVGGGQIQTDSTTSQVVSQSLGAQPEVDPEAETDIEMTVQTASNGDCEPSSTIDSSRFRVLNFG